MAKEIQLTQGKVTLVDDNMFEYLSQWKWYVYKCGNKFYAARNIKVSKAKIRLMLMHRFITNNKNTKMHTDHINGNGLDNRTINLRICTHSQNLINRGASINNKTGYKGVSYDKNSNKFKAQIRVNKKNITLLTTNNPVDAARAYNNAAIKYFGEFAQLNVIPKENLLNL
jgi:hypothetical protein